jgi:hypothetical protein
MAQVVSDAQRIMGQVSAMAMLDDAFRARLEAAPLDVLREFGMEVPGGACVEVVSDPSALASTPADDTVVLFVPNASDLSEEELSMVAGAVASCQSTAGTCCTFLCISSVSTASTNSCS